ncbi:LysR family transcriptional regulator [Devosia sp. MC532]|uniref:LysR substrate-binding domain-containing protein n=1 Tax=Devosia sp. MC532 TaxID=2799788 RepID=UPI0018F47EC7|nr:LysR substrate-binding domain-containing protein [Devosia sp. MC532]MBJ7577871.1 LysR family transcriptional regulator [Devosia sp. MC532]
MRDLNSLRIFRDVVKAGGYAAAYRQTGQSRATLSRHIAALEEELGARLIERSTRSFRLTGSGRILYERAVELFAGLDETVAVIEDRQHRPQGLVRITVPPSLLQLLIGREILKYLAEAPDVRVQIEATNRVADLRHDNVDLVIRARSNLDYPLDYVPVRLAAMELAIVAQPKWTEKWVQTLEQARENIPVLAWSGTEGESHWTLYDNAGNPKNVALQPRLIVDDIDTLRDATLAGLGMAQIPRVYVQDDLSIGRLVEIKTDFRPPISIVHAVHLGNRGMRPAVRHLLDWLKQATRQLN